MIKLRENTRHPLWRTPRHHMDHDHVHDHVHWIELFYDLVHVVAVFVLGNFLSHHLDLQGFIIFAGLFAVMWMAWADISWFSSLYVSTDIFHRLYMTLLIVTVMICTAAVDSMSHAESDKYLKLSWMYFVGAFAVNRFIIAWLYRRAKKIGDSDSSLPAEASRNYVLIGLGVVASGVLSLFAPLTYAFYLFAVVSMWHMVWFAVPKIGLMRHERNTPRYGHLSERFALLMLIVSGEGFFKLVLTLAEKGVYKLSPDILLNYVIGAIAIFTVCWIYYDFVGNAKPRDKKTSTVYKWTFAHLFIMMAAVMIGVGLVGEVKVHYNEPYPIGYGSIGCAGLALYLISLHVIKNNVEERLAHRFNMDWVRWFGIFMCGVTFFSVYVLKVPSIVGNLMWGTALFSQIILPLRQAIRTLETEGDL